MSAMPSIQSFADFEAESLPLITRVFKSKFGAVRWKDMVFGSGPEFKWLVEDMIPEGGIAMIAGASQSGKTFITLDLAMAVARGTRWFGKDVSGGGVIYFAAEDPTGVRALRVPAYRKAQSLSLEEDVPFVLLTERLNLWESADRAAELIEECDGLQREMGVPLKLIVIDTYGKATTGSDELSGKDISIIMDRAERIQRETGASVLWVDHMNASGTRVRGVAPKTANIDAVLICGFAQAPGEKRGDVVVVKDEDGRKIRELTNDIERGGKVKAGAPLETPLRFVLRRVELGTNSVGKILDSCVVALPSGEEIAGKEKSTLKPMSTKLSLAMKALKVAIDKKGRRPPDDATTAPNGLSCVTLADWRDTLAPMLADEGENPDDLKERVRDMLRKTATPTLLDRKYIGKWGDWVWRTNRKIAGIDPEPPRQIQKPEPDNPELDALIEEGMPF